LADLEAEPGPAIREGAVAIVDALGFRGIWRDHDPSDVVKVLRRAKRNVEGDAEYRSLLKTSR
jgi:hypothetical protein